MRNISIFVEDRGHEVVISTLLKRYAEQFGFEVSVISRSVTGGRGKMTRELAQYLREASMSATGLPDLIVIATDANCKGLTAWENEMRTIVQNSFPGYEGLTIYAVSDPHVERWLLIDSAAFKTVLGKGCKAPDNKCDKDRYKKLLIQAVLDAGSEPIFGGIEHAENIVNHMNLSNVESADPSLGRFIKSLRNHFNTWKTQSGS